MKVGRKSGTSAQEGSSKDNSPPGSDAHASAADRRAPAIAKSKAGGKAARRGFLDGQMLIAMPSMGDERFARAVIYMCAHSADGAMGIIVNQPAAHISFSDLLVQLDVLPAADLIQLPQQAGGVKVLKGGPVDTQRGFVLHSADFFIENSTLPIDEGICLTATLDISRRSPAATVRRVRCSRSVMRAGRRVSWRTRFIRTVGCTARLIPISSSAPIPRANTRSP